MRLVFVATSACEHITHSLHSSSTRLLIHMRELPRITIKHITHLLHYSTHYLCEIDCMNASRVSSNWRMRTLLILYITNSLHYSFATSHYSFARSLIHMRFLPLITIKHMTHSLYYSTHCLDEIHSMDAPSC